MTGKKDDWREHLSAEARLLRALILDLGLHLCGATSLIASLVAASADRVIYGFFFIGISLLFFSLSRAKHGDNRFYEAWEILPFTSDFSVTLTELREQVAEQQSRSKKAIVSDTDD